MTDRPKFSRAMMLRFGAVGLFLALGTFAVLHSLNNSPQDEPGESQAESETPSAGDESAIAAVGEKPVVDKTSFVSSAPDETKNRTSTPAWPPNQDNNKTAATPPAGLLPQSPPQNPLLSNLNNTKSSTPPSAPGNDMASADDKKINKLFPPPANSPSSGGNLPGGSFSGGSFGSSGSGFSSQQPPAAPPLAQNGTPNSSPPASTDSFAKGIDAVSPNGDLSQAEKPAASPGTSQFPPLKPADFGDSISSGESPANSGEPENNGFRVQVNDGDTQPASSLTTLANSRPENVSGGTTPGEFKVNSNPSTPPAAPRPDPWSSGSNGLRPMGNSEMSMQDRSGDTAGTPGMTSNSASTGLASEKPIQSSPSPAFNAAFGQTSPVSAPLSTSAGVSTQAVPGDTRLEGVQIPALAVQKVAPREVQVNREATFELVVKNTGRTPANQVRVHDQIPSGARFISANPPPTENNAGQLVWDLGTINPGQQVSIQTTVMPEKPGEIGSVAHVTFGAQATARTTCTQPQLSLRHEAPESVLVGQEFQMNIILENRGNGPAEEVVLLEDVPEGLDFGTGQKELEYPIGTLRPGEVRQVPLRLRASSVGHVKNVLVATGAGKLQAETTVNMRIVSPQLTLAIDGATRKFLKRPATHTITVSNPGSAAAVNVQVVARLPRGLQFSSANNQGQYDPNSHAVVWRLARLDSQKSGVTELVTVPIAAGRHEIQVQATAEPGQQQVASHSLEVDQLSSLYFDISETSGPVETGSPAAYRVRIVNQGQVPATNVTAQVAFAQGVRPESATGPVRAQVNGQTVIMEPVPSLSPGQELTFVIQATATGPGEHRSTLSVRSDDREVPGTKEISTHVYSDR